MSPGALLGLLALAALPLLAPAAQADPVPGRVALVLGEAAYAKLPALAGCAVSAQAVAERLRALGFDVNAAENASNGVMGAALNDLASRIAAGQAPTVVVYFCGYAAAFENRVFLLPVSASIDRPSDVLTEGVPAQSVLDLAKHGTRASLSALDTYQAPKGEPGETQALARFVAQAGSAGHFVVGVTESQVSTTATPLAQALSAELAKSPADLGAMVQRLDAATRPRTAGFASSGGAPAGPVALIPAPAQPVAPPPPSPAPPSASAPTPAPATAATPPSGSAPNSGSMPPLPALAPPSAAAPAPASPATPALPDESHYTASDRRQVQSALRTLGYYDGTIDGVIGPETRAAIRRYQHELGVPMTGTLTQAEATRLLAGSRVPATTPGGTPPSR